ncbi:MAG: hypothetical protein Q8L23_17690 [Caulobacter sp.]|nr:hypothetical protein [Caulobacter sp.]
MAVIALLLAGAMAFGHGPAADQRPFNASRANAIKAAAMQQGAAAPAPAATSVRYPSADGDILAGLGKAVTVPPLIPLRAAPPPRAPSAVAGAVDSSGLLGGPRQ